MSTSQTVFFQDEQAILLVRSAFIQRKRQMQRLLERESSSSIPDQDIFLPYTMESGLQKLDSPGRPLGGFPWRRSRGAARVPQDGVCESPPLGSELYTPTIPVFMGEWERERSTLFGFRVCSFGQKSS